MQRLQLPDSLSSDLEVWRLDLDLAAPVQDADWAILSEDEGVRALRFHKHEDKVRSVATRAALRRLLAARLRRAPNALCFMTNQHGKPRLVADGVSGAAMAFNVSHAGGFSLIAISRNSAVGVDIERCDAELDTRSLEAQVLSPFERELEILARPGFFECWVVKEAVLKALGLGVAEHLQSLSVLKPTGGDACCYGLRHTCADWPSVRACWLDAPAGYAAALAWQTKEQG